MIFSTLPTNLLGHSSVDEETIPKAEEVKAINSQTKYLLTITNPFVVVVPPTLSILGDLGPHPWGFAGTSLICIDCAKWFHHLL